MSHHLSSQQIDCYGRCWRSLILLPVRGPDLLASVKEFLSGRLDFAPDQIQHDFGRIAGRRVVEPRSKIDSEVIVEFSSASIRDTIKSSGYKLEGQTASIRMEVPNFLNSDFHVLQNLSYRQQTYEEECQI